jgi:hypothetical protein
MLDPDAIDREVAVARLRRVEALTAALEARLPLVSRSRSDGDAWLAAERLLDQALRTGARLAAQLVAAGALGAPESEAGMFACLGTKAWLSEADARVLVELSEAADALADGTAASEPEVLRAQLASAPHALRAFLRAAARRVGGAAQ